jgi:lysophospholipase L1-like esterase
MWERRFGDLDSLLGEMAEKNHAAGVPLVLMAVPEHAQTILLNLHDRPPTIDPYAFNRKIAEIAAKHDIVFVDLFNDFANAPEPNSLFYPEDGHLTPEGHLIVSRVITRTFVGSKIPGFSGCTLSRPSS